MSLFPPCEKVALETDTFIEVEPQEGVSAPMKKNLSEPLCPFIVEVRRQTAFPKSQSHIIHQTQQCFKKLNYYYYYRQAVLKLAK